MTEEKRRYISYLLRLWQIKEKGKLVWRASLESPQTGDIYGFAGLEELVAFLRRQGVSNNKQDEIEEVSQ